MSDCAYLEGFKWQIPIDADELFVLKNIELRDFIKKYDDNEYGFINFRWIDFHPTEKDDISNPNYFNRWKYKQLSPRGPSKIIYKWSPGNLLGDGHNLLIAKRHQIAEINPEQGFYAHFANRGKEQIKKKRIRIGEAFVEKYGIDSDKTQILEYKEWQEQGDIYFDQVWDNLCSKRIKQFQNLIYDPINPELFKI